MACSGSNPSGDGPGGRRPYYAMEFVGGGTLAGHLAAHGPLAPADAAGLLAAVARGVHAAHEAGIVHRDLKPGKILLGVKSEFRNPKSETKTNPNQSPNPEARQPKAGPVSLIPDSGLGIVSGFELRISDFSPKVTDFGLAKRRASDLTKSQAVLGTPAYMAPEQAGGKAKFVGPAADVYALGVVLFECLTGRPPFADADAWELAKKVMGEPAPSPRALARAVPRDLELICLKCLAKEPADRYATAEALADDLDAFRAGRPVVARPIPLVVRAGRAVRRHPTAAALAGLVAGLLLVVPPLVIWNQGRLDRHRAVAAEAGRAEQAAPRARDEAEKLAAAQAALAAEAEKRKAAAEQLATAREQFAPTSAIRRRLTDRPPTWTWANYADLTRAAAQAADPAARTALRSAAAATLLSPDLRSAAAATLLSPDLRPAGSVLRGTTCSAAAAAPNSPHGPVVALGEFKNWVYCHVWLVDAASGNPVRQLSFTGNSVPIPTGRGQDGVRALAFSPDGSRLFVGARSGRLFRFDLTDPAATGPAKEWRAEGKEFEQVAVSRDGRFVYGVVSRHHPVRRWDAETGQRSDWFSPPVDRATLAVTDPRTGDVVVANRHALFRVPAGGPSGEPGGVPVPRHPSVLAFTPGGRTLVAAMAEHVAVFDPETLQETARMTDPDLGGPAHIERAAAVAVHPSGAFAASAPTGDDDRRVKVWMAATGRLVGSAQVPGAGPIGVAWSPDGRFLFATVPNETLRFEFAEPAAGRVALTGCRPVRAGTFDPADGAVCGLAEGPDETRWYVLREPPGGGIPAATAVPGGPGAGDRPGVAPGGRTVVSLGDRPGLVLDPASPAGPTTLTPFSTRQPRYAPDGRTIWAIADGRTVAVWGARTGIRLGTFHNSAAELISGLPALEALAVGRTVAAVGGRDGTVHLLSPRAARLASYPKPGDPVMSVAVAPDGGLVAAGARSGSVRLIRPGADAELPGFGAHPGGVTGVSFAAGGTVLATGGKDRAVRVWRRAGDRFELLYAVDGLPAPVAGLEFGPRGEDLVVLLTNERAVRVWDLARLREQLAALALGEG